MFWKSKESIKPETVDELTEEEKETARQSESVDRVAEHLEKFRAYDYEEYKISKEYEPKVTYETINNRSYVKFGDTEFCSNYVTDIQVVSLGDPPKADYNSSYGRGYYSIISPASRATIRVNMSSGKAADIYCSRHTTDILFDKLKEVWKESLRALEKK